MNGIKPFKIEIPDEQLEDLRVRLKRTILPSAIKNAGWSYGPTNEFIQDMVDRLLTTYDWRRHEAAINRYPQFTTRIDGQDIHFLHVKSQESSALPLMLIHGWPGSIVEFLGVIDPLTGPVQFGGKREDAFHLVIPSLPGFGFSGATRESGWNNDRIAAAFNELMHRLGYERYGVQGGDAGAIVGPAMGRLAPKNVIGIPRECRDDGLYPRWARLIRMR